MAPYSVVIHAQELQTHSPRNFPLLILHIKGKRTGDSVLKFQGYFSSNREGGKGDDDLYSFIEEENRVGLRKLGSTKKLFQKKVKFPEKNIILCVQQSEQSFNSNLIW